MSNKSKFAALLNTRRAEIPKEPEISESNSVPEPEVKPQPITQAEKRPRGRPGGHGKSINPAYSQVTAYIPESLHLETKINLIKNGKREFSDLVEELLVVWNRAQVKASSNLKSED